MLRAAQIALAGKFHRDEAAAGRALDLDAVEFGLHRLHLRFEFGGLFHQAEKIRHRGRFRSEALPACRPVAGRRVPPAAAHRRFRRRGSAASTACTNGSPRTSSLSSALRVSACARSDGAPGFGRDGDHPAAAGPVSEFLGQVRRPASCARLAPARVRACRPRSARAARRARARS